MVHIGFLIVQIFVALLNTTLLVFSAFLVAHHYHEYIAILVYAVFGILCMVNAVRLNIKGVDEHETRGLDMILYLLKALGFLSFMACLLIWYYYNSFDDLDSKLAVHMVTLITVEFFFFSVLMTPYYSEEDNFTGGSRSRSNSGRNIDRIDCCRSSLGHSGNMFVPTTGFGKDHLNTSNANAPAPPPYISELPSLPSYDNSV